MIKLLTIMALVLVVLASKTCGEVEARANGQQPLVVSHLQHGRALDIIVHRTILTAYT